MLRLAFELSEAAPKLGANDGRDLFDLEVSGIFCCLGAV